jgi:hypothetical protein
MQPITLSLAKSLPTTVFAVLKRFAQAISYDALANPLGQLLAIMRTLFKRRNRQKERGVPRRYTPQQFALLIIAQSAIAWNSFNQQKEGGVKR